MALRELLLPWDAQPQEAVEPAEEFADLFAALIPNQSGIIGSAGGVWSMSGVPVLSAESAGLSWRASAYGTNGRHLGPTLDGATLTWPGVTVVAVLPRIVDLSTNQYPAIVHVAPSNEFYGIVNLAMDRQISGERNISFRAGNNTAFITPGTYNTAPGADQWAVNDRLVVVARWDGATISIAMMRNGEVTRKSNAHSGGWRSGSQPVSVGGYFRTTNRMLVSPIALAAIIPRDVGEYAEQRLLDNPWSLFQQRIPVPVSAGGSTTYTLSAPTYVPGSITSTGLTARVTVTAA